MTVAKQSENAYSVVYVEETGLKVLTKEVQSEEFPEVSVGGHHYEIHTESSVQTVEFQNGAIPKVGVNGATNEALLAIVIDRTEKLNAKFPCAENAAALEDMKNALFNFNERTRNRKARGVEGKHVA